MLTASTRFPACVTFTKISVLNASQMSLIGLLSLAFAASVLAGLSEAKLYPEYRPLHTTHASYITYAHINRN
jgi:hypothetical protein